MAGRGRPNGGAAGSLATADPFVGRHWERRELASAIAAAGCGRGELVMVSGEPGIGKTRLVREAVATATSAGLAAVWTTCWNGDDAPPYWPWVQLVRRVAGAVGPGSSPWSVDRSALAILVPELSDTALPARTGDHVAARARLFEAVLGLLRSATSGDTPLVVVFDDLHWADEPSLLLLRHVAATLPTLPITLVGTYREAEVQLDPARSPLFADLGRAGRQLHLTGLGAEDLTTLVAGTVDGEVPAGLVDALSERTAGNPFFAKEILRLLAARGAQAEQSLASVPPSVIDVVVQRLARLPQFVTGILETAAVIGDRFTLGDIPANGRDPQEVLEALDIAARAGLLAPADNGFGFTHALVQQALYENLGPARRAQLHRAVGLVLEARDAPAEVLARHFLAAVALGEHDRGLRYGLRAGENALARLAHEDAAAWFARVMAVVSPSDDDTAIAALLGRAEVSRRAGDPDASRRDLVAAVAAARRRQDATALARAALGLARLGTVSGEPQPELVELLEDAADGLGEEASDLRALLLSALASELWDHATARSDEAVSRSREALALAETGRTPATLARCLEASYTIAWTPDAAAERVDLAQRMVEVARLSGDVELHATAHLLHATALLELADPHWREVVERFFALGTALRLPRVDYLVLTRRACIAILEGDYGQASNLIEEAASLGRRIAEPDAFAVESHLYWELARLTGTRSELRGHEFPPPGTAHVSLYGHVWPPLLLLDAGDRDGARAAFDRAAAIPLDEVKRSWTFLHNVADLGEAAVRLDAPGVASRCYETLLPYAGRVSVVSGLVCFGGAVDHHLGFLALGLGNAAAAAGHLRSAVVIHERLGATPWAERSRALLAGADGAPTMAVGSLVREAKVWQISWNRAEAHVPDTKGMRDLAILLERAGQEVAAGELYAGQTGGRLPAPSDRGEEAVDRAAVAAYRKRLAEIEAELAAADADHDPGRCERAAAERDALIDELRRNFDRMGRPRRIGDTGERARKAVSARLREAIAAVEQAHPELGAHLRAAVRTGNYCSYQPAAPSTWTVRQI